MTKGFSNAKATKCSALAVQIGLLLTIPKAARAQTWTKLTNPPPTYVSDAILLTDGTVIVQGTLSCGLGTGTWYRLTPDAYGKYINGTWTQIASMPSGYGPDAFASAVLPDGRVIVEGGEYNLGSCSNFQAARTETYLGAIYNPATNAWTSVSPPTVNGTTPWSHIGDAPSVVLANGTFMLGNFGNCCNSNNFYWALLNASNLTWTTDSDAIQQVEQGWTLTPNGDVLTVQVLGQP